MVVANLSGGRDSSAMAVRFLELGNQIDYIIFCDTGFEFPAMYEYIDKLDSYIQRNFNHKLTRIDAGHFKVIERTFDKGNFKNSYSKTLITANGQAYLTKKLKGASK